MLAVALLSACGGEGTTTSRDSTVVSHVSDSADIRVVESSETALRTRLPWLTDTVPDWEIGGIDGEAPFVFAGIAGIVGLPDGSLVVVDGGSRELRWFTASGAHQLTVGGRGGGPTEFGRPELLSQFDRDSLVIFDRRGRRFVQVASDGSGMETLIPPDVGPRLLIGSPEAVVGSGVVFRSSESSPGACPENEHCELPMHLRWVDFDTGEGRILATSTRRWLNYVDASGRSFLLDGLLDQRALVAVGPEGPVVEGASHFELRQLDAGGDPLMIMRLSASTETASRTILDRYASRASDPPATKRIYDLMELPDALPAFDALEVDRVGHYWAELFTPDDGDPPEWLVFDDDGRALGIVTFPAGFEVASIGRDYVLGIWTDQLDVEYVRRYSLER